MKILVSHYLDQFEYSTISKNLIFIIIHISKVQERTNIKLKIYRSRSLNIKEPHMILTTLKWSIIN